MRRVRSWRRVLTLWLAVQLLAGTLSSLAAARPLWTSFLSVLNGPACIEQPGGDGPPPAASHTPLCVLCLALGGPALAPPPVVAPGAAHPVDATTTRPATQAAGSARKPAAQGCRGPPLAA